MALSKFTQVGAGERRHRYFVDAPVQGALLRQAIVYWLWASATFALISFVYRVVPALLSEAPERVSIWRDLGPFAIASIVLFPIVVLSAIRFSNRFVGPMVRVRRTLSQLARGESPQPLTLRNDDFWSDIVQDINAIVSKLHPESLPARGAADIEEDACDEDLASDRNERQAEVAVRA